ncbi:GNAT family N-acetyltransferase [Luteolibacter soli]|uniref:GNAT family N-acetyltransferase n=1 Tax=Luteolibacter soli TaxID=3135280 RepID=A0ABU9AZU7_9BACT
MFSTADRYWAGHLNCLPDQLLTKPFDVVTHGEELRGYSGALGLFRDGTATVSVPPDREEELRGLLAGLENGCTPEQFAAALAPVAALVLGPAYLGYTTEICGDDSQARALNEADAAAVKDLREACGEEEWDHGGSSLEVPCSGVFHDGQLVALAGYETWGETIAHLYIVTHPGYRGRGFGRSAVAHLARRALTNGLLAQYRTLDANTPSIRIAEALGFQRYATSMAVRLAPVP